MAGTYQTSYYYCLGLWAALRVVTAPLLEHRSLLAPAAPGCPVSPPPRHLHCSHLCLLPPLLQCRGPDLAPSPFPSLGSAEAISSSHTAAVTPPLIPPHAVSPGSRPAYLTASEATRPLDSSCIPRDWSPKAAFASHPRGPPLLSRPVSITGSPRTVTFQTSPESDQYPHPLTTTGPSHLDYGSRR